MLKQDRDLQDVNLDGYIHMHLPRSFDTDSKNFQPRTLENFYGLEPSELSGESFKYIFVRGSHTNAGGNTVRPVLLILLVHDGSKKTNADLLFDDSRYERIAEYEETHGGFNLYLYSLEGKLDRSAAQAFLANFGPRVQIKAPWKKRLKEIEASFHQKYPEKKPLSK